MGNSTRFVQAQCHVDNATCLAIRGDFTDSSHALAVEIEAVGVMDRMVEDGVGGIADQHVGATLEGVQLSSLGDKPVDILIQNSTERRRTNPLAVC